MRNGDGVETWLGWRRIRFPRNVRWRCRRCGMCCGDTASHLRRILMTGEEGEEVTRGTGLRLNEFSTLSHDQPPYTREVRKVEGKCFFLKDDCCTIYSRRPLVCRFYPFGLHEDGDTLTFTVTGEPCRGLGRGKVLGEPFFKRLYEKAVERLGRGVRSPPRLLPPPA